MEQGEQRHIPTFVDWLVGAFLVLGGFALAMGGSALWLLVDRSMIAAAVADGSIQSDSLAGADLVDVTVATVTWSAIGLLLTGFLLFVVGVGYVAMRRRDHARRAAGEPTSDYLANALVGAVASGLLSFVPFSPVLGGAVAGYFERGESDRVVSVGALSGLLALAPVVTIVLFVLGGVIAGLAGIGETSLALLVAVVLLFVVMVVATIGEGLGAIGGYVGGRLADDDYN